MRKVSYVPLHTISNVPLHTISYVPLHTISYVPLHTIRPPDESAYLKIIFLIFSSKTFVVRTQKTRLNETVLLGTQNTCFKWCVRKLLHFYP